VILNGPETVLRAGFTEPASGGGGVPVVPEIVTGPPTWLPLNSAPSWLLVRSAWPECVSPAHGRPRRGRSARGPVFPFGSGRETICLSTLDEASVAPCSVTSEPRRVGSHRRSPCGRGVEEAVERVRAQCERLQLVGLDVRCCAVEARRQLPSTVRHVPKPGRCVAVLAAAVDDALVANAFAHAFRTTGERVRRAVHQAVAPVSPLWNPWVGGAA
jgi:hypothetical protein